MTVGSLLEGAFRLIRERPGAFLIWAVIYALVAVGTSYAMTLIIGGQIEAMMAGATEAEVALSSGLKNLLLSIISLMITAIIYAAAQRAILRPEEGGPGFLRLGMDEVRLFLLAFLYVFVFTIVAVILAVILGLFLGGAGTGTVNGVALITGLIAVVAGAYFCTKLSLTFPVTLIRRRFAIGEGWGLTNGHFWTLFAAYLIICLILIGLAVAIGLATQQVAVVALFNGMGTYEERMQAEALREYYLLSAGGIDGSMVLQWVAGGIQGALGVALIGGTAATAAKDLTADAEGLSDTFA
jgi:hypothetical protein